MDITTILLGLGLVVAALVLGVVAIMVMGRDGEDAKAKPKKRRRRATTGSTSAVSPAKAKYNWLIGREGSVKEKAFHIGGRTATIGRGLGNFIQVGDESVSEVHVQFRGTPTGMEIKDNDSSNGTEINGEPINDGQFHHLNDGDTITLGDNTMFAYRRSGDFRDDALTQSKDVKASSQKKTEAMGALGGELQSKIKEAVEAAGGDVDEAAEQ